MGFDYALRRSPSVLKALLWLLALSLPAIGYAQSAAPVFPNPGKVSMSREDQRSLGMQAASEVYKTMPVLPDSSPGGMAGSLAASRCWSPSQTAVNTKLSRGGPPGQVRMARHRRGNAFHAHTERPRPDTPVPGLRAHPRRRLCLRNR